MSLLLVSVTTVKSQYVFQRVSGVYKLKNVSGFVTTTVTNQNNESSEVVFPMNDIPTNFVVKVVADASDSIIIGRTVWEFEKLLPEWVNCINNSQVDFVSVPTEWNKDSFIKSGVKKPIIVELKEIYGEIVATYVEE